MCKIKLNEALIHKKGLGDERRRLLINVHKQLQEVLNNPDTENYTRKEILWTVRGLEATIQYLYGFHIDPRTWYYEFYLDGCTCPSEESKEASLFDAPLESCARPYDKGCPYHGHLAKEEE